MGHAVIDQNKIIRLERENERMRLVLETVRETIPLPNHLRVLIDKVLATWDKADIKRVQQACNLLTDSKLVVDGVYGPVTKAAVAHLQAKEE